MTRPIVHASDLSAASRAAFAGAVDVARREHAELLVVHVMAPVPMPVGGDGSIPPPAWKELLRAHRRVAQRRLDARVRRAGAAGARARGLLLDGVPARAILDTARRRHARMIVVGTHGRRGLARLVLGSVAGRVVAGATCPVMTVRGR
jgi:nucleotide-binding universal stress UspA family protein